MGVILSPRLYLRCRLKNIVTMQQLSRPRRFAHAALGRMPKGLALPILGGPLRGKRWLIRSANYSCWLGTYERTKQRAFATEVRPGAVVFDIGAHVGFYSLLSAVLSKPGGRVFAFEPFPLNAANLRRHVALNHVPVEVIEAAVADREADGRFEVGADSYTGSLGEQGAPVRVVTIDGLCIAGKLPQPDIVKVDVEGAEALVLRGASETIRLAQPVIFVAVHGAAARTECLELLEGFGYRTEPLTGSGIEPGTEFVAQPRRGRVAGVGPARVP
jgi:FkbM family methyltransferase